MNLRNKKCLPCVQGSSPLTTTRKEEYLANLDGWHINSKGEIEKDFTFKNFSKALAFVNIVGDIAERENHHPDIEFGWGYCKIRLVTHSVGGLHENDFIIAAKIEDINE